MVDGGEMESFTGVVLSFGRTSGKKADGAELARPSVRALMRVRFIVRAACRRKKGLVVVVAHRCSHPTI